MPVKKAIRIIKKIREESGTWKFVSLKRAGVRYQWDKRPGHYFVEWWEGRHRRRESAGITPSEAMEAQRRKRNELIGALVLGSSAKPQAKPEETPLTPLVDAIGMFLDHVRVHSPDKPRTVRRYTNALDHVKRILGRKMFVEAITRPDIDDYKATRSGESSDQHPDRRIIARTINYEIAVLRTFFYFLAKERNLPIANPCAKFKLLKDPHFKAKRRPPTYREEELNRLFAVCDPFERTTFPARDLYSN